MDTMVLTVFATHVRTIAEDVNQRKNVTSVDLVHSYKTATALITAQSDTTNMTNTPADVAQIIVLNVTVMRSVLHVQSYIIS